MNKTHRNKEAGTRGIVDGRVQPDSRIFDQNPGTPVFQQTVSDVNWYYPHVQSL